MVFCTNIQRSYIIPKTAFGIESKSLEKGKIISFTYWSIYRKILTAANYGK